MVTQNGGRKSHRHRLADGHKMVTKSGEKVTTLVLQMVPRWSQDGHKMVTRWPKDDHKMVTKWSQDGHKMVIRWSQKVVKKSLLLS